MRTLRPGLSGDDPLATVRSDTSKILCISFQNKFLCTPPSLHCQIFSNILKTGLFYTTTLQQQVRFMDLIMGQSG